MTDVPFPLRGFTSKFSGGPDGATTKTTTILLSASKERKQAEDLARQILLLTDFNLRKMADISSNFPFEIVNETTDGSVRSEPGGEC